MLLVGCEESEETSLSAFRVYVAVKIDVELWVSEIPERLLALSYEFAFVIPLGRFFAVRFPLESYAYVVEPEAGVVQELLDVPTSVEHVSFILLND